MNPHVKKAFAATLRANRLRPARALEVGGKTERSMLTCRPLEGAELVCLNLGNEPDVPGIRFVQGNGNRMDMFDDASFDVVASNAMLEHDRRFWLSVAEMRRVLRPGGLLFIGVPGYLPNKKGDTSHHPVFRFHGEVDYWRFSDMAVREEFFAGFERVEVRGILDPPRIIGHGFRPR